MEHKSHYYITLKSIKNINSKYIRLIIYDEPDLKTIDKEIGIHFKLNYIDSLTPLTRQHTCYS